MTARPKHQLAGYWPLVLWALPLAWLWGLLINHLRVAWSTNPQYAYGVAVPFLCLYLIWRRVGRAEGGGQRAKDGGRRTEDGGRKTEDGRREAEVSGPGFSFSAFQLFSFSLLALLLVPIRLVQEANPEWTLVSWTLALEVIALTLLMIHLVRGPWSEGRGPSLRSPFQLSAFSVSAFVFPICFFLVAVPWPSVIEQPVIQGLTRLNTAFAIEILGWLNIPALQQGNVIELSTGAVGIDEACSGIRSLQATLMISLFLGEIYALSAARRLLLVLAGFALALVCNLARTLLLCWVAAERGVAAVAGWHDPAGVTILVGCFVGLWLVARRFQRKAEMLKTEMLKSEGGGPRTEDGGRRTEDGSPAAPRGSQPSTLNPQPLAIRDSSFSFSAFQLFSFSLLSWLVVVELGVALWYRHVEGARPAQPTWHIAWPPTNAVCRDIPIAPIAAELLRYDQARQVQWMEVDDTRWQLSWFYWKPGQAAAYIAKSHNPLICMPAAGFQVVAVSPVEFVDVGGLRMPVRVYKFAKGRNSIHVLYGRWEDQAVEQPFGSEGVTGQRFNLLRSVWSGRGKQGQRVISLALWTGEDAPGAREQLIRQLQRLLVVEPLR